MSSFYNLPDAWNPGFVFPKNVDDEGLERRAFITKQMPRGTYDDPAVGTGGFVVPRYVTDEGYGQGTFTTKWQPSGSYDGPKIPAWLNQRPKVVRTQRMPGGGQVVTIQALGDTPLPQPYEDYGQRAAQILINRVAVLPIGQRAAALRSIVDRVDKSLWPRTQQIWNRYRAQGMAPATAFPLALSRALSAGIAAEIINTGLRGSAPQAKSLLGLGCYGCMAALGADEPAPAPAPALCAPPAGFTFVAATDTVPGHWERARSGVPPQPGPCAPGGQTPVPVVVDHRTTTIGSQTSPTAGVAVSPTKEFTQPFFFRPDIPTDKVRNFAGYPDIMVVPDSMPDSQLQALIKAPGMHVMRELPSEWAAWIKTVWTTPGDGRIEVSKFDEAHGYRRDDYWSQVLGIPWGSPIYGPDNDSLPQAHVVWPVDQSDLGLYAFIEPLNRSGPDAIVDAMNGKPHTGPDTNPRVLKIWISKVREMSTEYSLSHFFASIALFFAHIVDVAVDALKDIGDVACDVLNAGDGKVGQVAGATVAVVVGAPPQAGVAGATIARNACGRPPPPTPPPLSLSSSILPVAMLAGGAFLAVALLTKRKKKHP